MTLTLDSSKRNLADLFRIEVLPRLVVHVLKEWNDIHWINKVDESVPDIAAIVEVKRQVEEVISALVMSVNALQEHILGILVRNMANHNRCASILTTEKSVQVHGELRIAAGRGAL